ncbi:MAG: hypothetical protein HOP97_05665, partial [Terrabacter sp.]|nr:hypothetical protein [Terrabacter sp.]
MFSIRPRLAVIATGVLLVSGCAGLGQTPDDTEPGTSTPSSSASPSGTGDPASPEAEAEATEDPDAPWGPTTGELEQAQELVSTWSSEQLAGGVIVGRFHGTDPQEPARMVRDLHLAGVSVTGANVADRDQVLAMTSALADAAQADGRDFPPVIGVDQEGGY